MRRKYRKRDLEKKQKKKSLKESQFNIERGKTSSFNFRSYFLFPSLSLFPVVSIPLFFYLLQQIMIRLKSLRQNEIEFIKFSALITLHCRPGFLFACEDTNGDLLVKPFPLNCAWKSQSIIIFFPHS